MRTGEDHMLLKILSFSQKVVEQDQKWKRASWTSRFSSAVHSGPFSDRP